jgi:hypothetical protein
VPARPDSDGADALRSTDRTTLRRKKERGSYDRDMVNAILDEGLLCHVGFSVDGSTFVLPMAYARIGDALYLHGAVGNRMLRHMAQGAEVCVTVTLVDGLVLARSAFHHSMNYRSVMLLGTTERVVDDDEKYVASMALIEHIVPGRSTGTRPPSVEELRAVLMVRMPIAEGSAKIRTDGPIDEPEDLQGPYWAGHIPLSIVAGEAVAESGLPPEVQQPEYVRFHPGRGARTRSSSS